MRESAGRRSAVQHGSETNLGVDLLHTLEVGLSGALGAENKVLSKCQTVVQPLMNAIEERRTISSSDSRFVSGTKNQMKAAPR